MANNEKPLFVDTVTRVPAYWANAVSDLIYDVFGAASTKDAARNALGLGTMAIQSASAVQIAGGSIDNTAIGLTVPMEGHFSILSVDNDPQEPTHVVNKRSLLALQQTIENRFLRLDGGTMQGMLTLAGDPALPLDAVPQRWVDQRLLDVLGQRPIQRYFRVSQGDTEFHWQDFIRPSVVFPENFLVYVDGQFQTYGRNYTVNTAGKPVISFGTPIEIDREVDILYIYNVTNLLELLPPVVPPLTPFMAAPGWSNPINVRINYHPYNEGENQITNSHTVLRQMFLSCVVLTGALQDRVISWQTHWIPKTPAAHSHPPVLLKVSDTEAQLTLPVGEVDSYWEGRMEIAMLVDGMQMGHKLWMDMNNQVLPDQRDGLVRWGYVGPQPVIYAVIDNTGA